MMNTMRQDNFELTGRHVLYMVLGFFGAVFAANAIFIYFALSTFSGLDVENPYEKGRAYNAEIAAARAQAERGWTVDVTHGRTPGGGLKLKVAPKDKSGAIVTGLAFSATLKRPTQASADQTAMLRETEAGVYVGALNVPLKGQWLLELVAYRDRERVYLSRNRILLK